MYKILPYTVFLNGLNLFNESENDFLYKQMPPQYASSLHFELYESGNVRIFYKNNLEINEISVCNCNKSCSLDDWYKIYASIIPTKPFNQECKNPCQ